jgi:hypothetical protein
MAYKVGAFFDSEAVIKAMDAKSRKALGKIGAYVRRTAKSSLKYRDGPSTPGTPPHVHRGAMVRHTKNKKTGAVKTRGVSPLRELWFFGVDLNTMSVVVGPAIFRKVNTVPMSLERGGQIEITLRQRGPHGKSIRERRVVRIAARPTAEPAKEANLGMMAAAWTE